MPSDESKGSQLDAIGSLAQRQLDNTVHTGAARSRKRIGRRSRAPSRCRLTSCGENSSRSPFFLCVARALSSRTARNAAGPIRSQTHSDARRRSVEHRLAEHQRPPMVDERESTSTSFDDLPARLLQHRALFLEEMAGIRPQLHRFCSRMGGSLLDGEDIVQDVLVQAFYKLPTLEDVTRLRPWLFRIAHNKCIDHLRRHRGVELVPVEEDELDVEAVEEPAIRVRVGEAFATLVTSLPPKERASVVLKDVLDYPLS